MKQLVRKLLGGRPMRFVEYCFTDCVVGKAVNLYEDTLGRRWLAFGPWSLDRMRK